MVSPTDLRMHASFCVSSELWQHFREHTSRESLSSASVASQLIANYVQFLDKDFFQNTEEPPPSSGTASFHMSGELYKRFREKAQGEDVTRSWIFTRMVRGYVDFLDGRP